MQCEEVRKDSSTLEHFFGTVAEQRRRPRRRSVVHMRRALDSDCDEGPQLSVSELSHSLMLGHAILLLLAHAALELHGSRGAHLGLESLRRVPRAIYFRTVRYACAYVPREC